MWNFSSSQDHFQKIPAVPQQPWWCIIRNSSGHFVLSQVLSIVVLVSISSTHHCNSSSSWLDKASSKFSTHSNYQVPWVEFGWLAWWFSCIPSQHLVVTTYPSLLLPAMVHVCANEFVKCYFDIFNGMLQMNWWWSPQNSLTAQQVREWYANTGLSIKSPEAFCPTKTISWSLADMMAGTCFP